MPGEPAIQPRPPAERRRLRRTALLTGMLAAAVVLVAVVLVLRQGIGGPTAGPPGGPNTPQRPAGTPTSSAPPQPAPGATEQAARPPSAYTRMTAEDSRLYNVSFARSSARCAGLGEQRPPLPDARLVAYLQQIADCLTEVNAAPLEEQGIALSAPRVSGFNISVNTACGTLTRYAFYCPEDRTIYVDTRSDDTRRFYGGMRLGYFAVISHEFGHHLQLAGGITQGYADRLATADNEQRLELSRRSELQAGCFSGVAYGALWSSIDADTADREEMADYFDRQSDEVTREGTHGSARTMKAWFDRGLGTDRSSYARCNTWAATPDQVA
ncbi:putative neutral zinc metallopeptidase [Propionibacteriaceae bacterium ES.041]|nr:putative neutral zinc metallopeptidase [Propionibacteriaceae bacterium ES.041]